MSDTVIRDFLVSLGFTTDNEGARKMGDALEGVTKKSVVLRTALLALATGTVLAVAKTAGELDKLYYSSQRIGASAENIRAYGDAISQMGGDAQGALQSLESVGQKMRNSPGYEGVLQNLGVATRDGNGAMRDRVEVMKDLSKTFKDMPSYQANAYASSLGIDEKTMLAMRDGKFIDNMEKYQKVRSQVGLNDELAKSGSQLMTEFNDTTIMTKAITEVVVMTAGKALLPILKLINKTLTTGIEMFDSLNPNIKAFLATGLKIATVVVVFGGLIGVLGKIGTVLPLLKGLLFLIRGLNLAFLASPIGIVLALASAIALLWDDYQTWKNGGESLIDWSKWSGGIETAIDKIKELGRTFDAARESYIGLANKLNEKIAETETGKSFLDSVGEGTAKTLAFMGNEEAKEAVRANEEAKREAATRATAGIAAKTLKGATELVGGGASGRIKGAALKLSEQDIVDIMKVTSTEVVGSLKGKDFEQQAAGVVDTILNRTASGKYGDGTVRGVLNQKWAFSDINAPRKGAYGSVQNVPMSRVTPKMEKFVRDYLAKRAAGQESSVGGNISYANPHHLGEASSATKKWVREVEKQAKKTGQVFGSGKAVHVHGTPSADQHKMPKPFSIHLGGSGNVASNLTSSNMNLRNSINTNSTNATLLPSNYSANSTAKNVTIHQSYKADMHINGADNPQMVANAIKRETESSFARAAHNARGVMG